jgi:hypothetical protein
MYEAIICRVQTQPHPNADKLLIGDAAGYSVIVGKDTATGELGILFPEGGCIAVAFCLANGLLRKHPETGAPLGGYLDESGRVRALKLRGAVSEGLWLPLAGLDMTGFAELLSEVDEGDRVSGALCQKYITPATRRAMAKFGATSPQARAASALPRHYDTPQLRDLALLPWALVPEGEQLVGDQAGAAAGAVDLLGRDDLEQPLGRLARLWNWLAPSALAIRPKTRHEYVSGTRNCTLDFGAPGEKGMGYRARVHAQIVAAANLAPDEVWYYEISGYADAEDGGAPIMGRHRIEAIGDSKLEAKLRKRYGDVITYTYDCEPGQNIVHVYRITQGDRELTYDEIDRRVSAVGFEPAPLLSTDVIPRSAAFSIADLRHEAALLANQDGGAHPVEGVCVRFETTAGEVISKAYKHKSFVFCALEGIARNDAEYVDAEEVA